MPQTHTSKWASVIVAAGNGTRFGGDTPKQFLPLLGQPVLAYSLRALSPHGPVIVVVSEADRDTATRIIAPFANARLAVGGDTRQASVKSGLAALQEIQPQYVMIHDAARPLLDTQSVARLMQKLEQGAQSATLATPVHDTLVRRSDIVDRTGVFAVQTPQAFDYKLLYESHTQTQKSFTDDASLVQAGANIAPTLVQGNPDNMKITTSDDFARAQKILLANLPETRTGFAFDVHKFGPAGSGDYVTLCGVRIPSDRPLMGHSDADAPLHALADAILGTIGAGDIGVHFPPTDPQWKGMDSALIVQKALELLHEKGGTLRHADIMIMSETPKIGPHREAMQQRLAGILGLPADAVGLKATTMEQMGFVGRGEGLTAQAVVTVRMPVQGAVTDGLPA